MNYFKKAFIFQFVLITLLNHANAQNIADSASIEDRISDVERDIRNGKERSEISNKKMEKYVDESIENNNKDIKQSMIMLKFLSFIGFPLTAGAVVLLYINAIKRAKKLINDKIEGIVEKNRVELIKLIESQEFDSKLRATKRILVLGSSDSVNTQLQSVMDKMDFKNIKFRTVTNYTRYSDYDLIVFNNSDGSFPQEVITNYIDKETNDHIAFIAFTTSNLNRHEKLNFANSRFTLYHNILNTLKYSEILKSSSQ